MASVASVAGASALSTAIAANSSSERTTTSLQIPGVSSFSGLRCNSLSCTPSTLALFGLSNGRASNRKPSTIRAVVEAPAVPKQKIRIKLRSYWVDLIEKASQQILDVAKETGVKSMGPVRLPTRRRIYCVLRSPHVDKDSREHFQTLTHKRLIDLENPNAQTIDALMQLDIPAGVDVEVKLQ